MKNTRSLAVFPTRAPCIMHRACMHAAFLKQSRRHPVIFQNFALGNGRLLCLFNCFDRHYWLNKTIFAPSSLLFTYFACLDISFEDLLNHPRFQKFNKFGVLDLDENTRALNVRWRTGHTQFYARNWPLKSRISILSNPPKLLLLWTQ